MIRVIALCASFLALAACASIQPQRGFDQIKQTVATRTGQTIEWHTGSPSDHKVSEKLSALLTRPLSLNAATQIALLNNAHLQSKYEQLGIAQASLVQAGLLRNPVFDAAIRFNGGERPTLDFDISQDFLSIFTLALRKKIAGYEFKEAKLGLTLSVIDFSAEVREAFYQLQAATQAAELLQEMTDTSNAILSVTTAIHKAGNIPSLKLDRQKAMHQETLLIADDVETERLRQHEKLSALMGLWGENTEWAIDLDHAQAPSGTMKTGVLIQQAIDMNLQLGITRSQIEKLSAQLGLKDITALIPELDIGYSGERGADGLENGIGFGIKIPIFDTGKAQKFGIRSEIRSTQWLYVAQATDIRAAARNAATQLQRAQAKLTQITQQLLPLRQQITRGAMREYNAMQIGVSSVLQDQQKHLETEQKHVSALMDYWLARARLEQLLSGSMAGSGMMASGRDMSSDNNNSSSEEH